MTQVPEHDAKQEREGHHVEDSRVNLLIAWCPICNHYLMKPPSEFVHFKVRWWCQTMLCHLL